MNFEHGDHLGLPLHQLPLQGEVEWYNCVHVVRTNGTIYGVITRKWYKRMFNLNGDSQNQPYWLDRYIDEVEANALFIGQYCQRPEAVEFRQ